MATQAQEHLYGIVKSGTTDSAIAYDSFVSFKLNNNVHVSTFPVEKGAFVSYNKAGTPYKITVRLAVSGDATKRNAFAQALETLLNSLDTVTIVTPDASYFNANLMVYDYARSAEHNGWGRIVADLHFQEVRIVNVQYTSVKPPAAQKPKANGQVQPRDTIHRDIVAAQAAKGRG